LSHSGCCSRRNALEIIKSGRVFVNGKITPEPSYPVDAEKDRIFLDNKKITLKAKSYLMLNKPVGVTTTRSDRYAEVTVMDLLPKEYRHLYPVGRLDKDTEGLLLLTNDGDLAYRLMHPKFNVHKEYLATITKKLKDKDRLKLKKGVFIENKKTSPCRIKELFKSVSHSDLTVSIHEGRKRQIRLMFLSLGYKVIRLRRVSEGCLKLGALKPGKWRALGAAEISSLYKECGLKQ